MDNQGLSSVTNESISPELGPSVSQKHNLSPVIDLRPVDEGIRPISEEIVQVQENIHVRQEMQRVGGQLHQVGGGITVVGGELTLTGDIPVHQVSDDPTTDPLAVTNEDTLTMDGEITNMDNSQDVQAMTHQVTDTCCSCSHLVSFTHPISFCIKVNTFLCRKQLQYF